MKYSRNIINISLRAKALKVVALLLFMALSAVWSAKAQTDMVFSQFYDVPSLYNPAAIGMEDYIRIRAGGRLQWVGVDNAPKSFVGVADTPFKLFGKRWAGGLNVQTLSEGLYKTLNINGQLGYKFKKFKGEFTVALQFGLYDQSFKGSDVFIPDDDNFHDPDDDAIPKQDIHGTAIDLGAGLFYRHKYFSAGLSVTHATEPKIKLSADSEGGGNGSVGETGTERYFEFTAKRQLYFFAEGNIPIKNTLYEILPSIIVHSNFTFTSGEIMARVRYKKFLSAGIGYRYKDAITATVGAEFKNFYIGYSYDYALTAIRKATSGSHELFVGYRLKLDLGEKNRHRHKSVRLL